MALTLYQGLFCNLQFHLCPVEQLRGFQTEIKVKWLKQLAVENFSHQESITCNEEFMNDILNYTVTLAQSYMFTYF